MAEAVVRDGMVQMLDRSGAPVAVPQAEIQKAYQAGYSIEAPEQVKRRELEKANTGLGNEALTAAEGAASGLTFGLSDQALVAGLGEEYRKNAEARARLNPNARMAGEIGGAIAPAFLTGGESLLGTAARVAGAPGRAVMGVGRAAERGVARAMLGLGARESGALVKGARMAASGAVEGAAYSTGREISEAALGNTQLTAERLLGAAQEGAAWGALGGGAIGAGSAVIGAAGKSAVRKMLGGRTLQQAAKEFAEKQALKGVGVQERVFQRIGGPERAKRLGEKLLKAGVKTDDAAGALRNVAAKAEEATAKMQTVARALDDTGVKVSAQRALQQADNNLAKIRETPLGSYQAAAKRVEKEIEPIRQAVNEGRDLTFGEMLSVRDKLDDIIKPSAKGDPATDALRDFRNSIDETLTQAVETKGDDALHAAAGQGDETARALLTEQRNAKDAWRQVTEDAQDWQLMRESAEELAASPEKPRFAMGPGAAEAVSGNLFGVLTGIATGNFGIGAVTGMASSMAMGAAHKYIRDRGAGMIAKFAERIGRAEVTAENAAQLIATGKGAAIKAAAAGATESFASRYQNLVQQVNMFQSDPQAATEYLAEATGEVAARHPELAEAITTRMISDAQYLATQMPPTFSRAAESMTPFAETTTVSSFEQRRIVRIAEALNAPGDVFNDIASGSVDLDQIEAVKTQRPEMFADMRMRVAQYVAERDESLPFQQRNFVGQIFEFPADWSLIPQNFATLQADQPPPPPEQMPNQPGGAAPAKLDPDVFSGSMQTPSQMAIGDRS